MNKLNFEEIGFQFIGPSCMKGNNRTKMRRFKCFFGATPEHVTLLWWELLESKWFDHAPSKVVKPVHLLMALHFLKSYNVEELNASFFCCDKKTFRKWSWFILKGIAKLDKKIVSFFNCIFVFLFLSNFVYFFR